MTQFNNYKNEPEDNCYQYKIKYELCLKNNNENINACFQHRNVWNKCLNDIDVAKNAVGNDYFKDNDVATKLAKNHNNHRKLRRGTPINVDKQEN